VQDFHHKVKPFIKLKQVRYYRHIKALDVTITTKKGATQNIPISKGMYPRKDGKYPGQTLPLGGMIRIYIIYEDLNGNENDLEHFYKVPANESFSRKVHRPIAEGKALKRLAQRLGFAKVNDIPRTVAYG